MSAFESDRDYGPMTGASAKLQQCKRDYEAEIKRFREAQETAAELRDAVYKYVSERGGSRSGKPFTLAELIGRLELDIRESDSAIAELIAMQEKDKD